MLNPEHFIARPTPPGLHFVANEDAAVLTNNRDSFFEILFRWSDETADAQNRFSHKSRNFSGSRRLDQFFQVFGASQIAFGIGQFERATITIGRRSEDVTGYLSR